MRNKLSEKVALVTGGTSGPVGEHAPIGAITGKQFYTMVGTNFRLYNVKYLNELQ